MISRIYAENIGPIQEIDFQPSPRINVITGENDSGKTLFLKFLYASVRALEEFKRGSDQRTFKNVLDNKLIWTFQVNKLGDLVRKGANSKLKIQAIVNEQSVSYGFGGSAQKGVGECSDITENRKGISLFIPAKEVVSLSHIIKKSRGIDQEFGFDDTYYDLLKGLEKHPGTGKNYASFSNARKKISEILNNGTLEYSDDSWSFKRGNSSYSIHVTAEGIKKISILYRLLGNRIISPNSILFIDEPESHLHPNGIMQYMEILALLSMQGIQIFLSTHSFFVIKKLMILHKKNLSKLPVQIISISNGKASISDISFGLPSNPIINASIALFNEEISI